MWNHCRFHLFVKNANCAPSVISEALNKVDWRAWKNSNLWVAKNCGTSTAQDSVSTLVPFTSQVLPRALQMILCSWVTTNNPHKLQSLLNLSLKFCEDKFMKLVTDETHLLVLLPKSTPTSYLMNAPILLDDDTLQISSSTEHSGLLQSNSFSNITTLQDWFAKHMKALYPVLSAWAARGHGANPAASQPVEQLYSLRFSRTFQQSGAGVSSFF